MGNSFPVTEDHRGPLSLMGQPLKSGYTSHFVLCNRDGFIFQPDKDTLKCSEIVVDQESHILPAFILSFDSEICLSELDTWLAGEADKRIAPKLSSKVLVPSKSRGVLLDSVGFSWDSHQEPDDDVSQGGYVKI